MVARFEIIDSGTVRDENGREYDVLAAIGALPWVRQLCPQMPHEYRQCRTSRTHSSTRCSRRWSGPAIPRATGPTSADTRARCATGRHPTACATGRPASCSIAASATVSSHLAVSTRVPGPSRSWDGPPWAPNGSGIYQRDSKGRWWPSDGSPRERLSAVPVMSAQTRGSGSRCHVTDTPSRVRAAGGFYSVDWAISATQDSPRDNDGDRAKGRHDEQLEKDEDPP